LALVAALQLQPEISQRHWRLSPPPLQPENIQAVGALLSVVCVYLLDQIFVYDQSALIRYRGQ
jgi:hypothetical protein